MGHRRNWLVLAASVAAHVALLAAWLSTRPEFRFVEPPAMAVELVRLRAPPSRSPSPIRSPRKASPTRSEVAESQAPPAPAPVMPPAPPERVAPRQMTDEELLAGAHMTPRQIRDAPVKDLLWGPGKPRPKCKPAEGYPGPPLPCPGDLGKDPNRPFDVDRDAPDSELAKAGRYKRAMKAYHEAPGGAGYPGIACAIFHRC